MTKSTLDAEFSDWRESLVRVRCATCQFPSELREWVDQRLREDVTPMRQIAEFCTLKGHKITWGAISNHKQAGHHVSG